MLNKHLLLKIILILLFENVHYLLKELKDFCHFKLFEYSKVSKRNLLKMILLAVNDLAVVMVIEDRSLHCK